MPILHRTGSWRIRVQGREHGEPHFHLQGIGWECVVSILDLRVLTGDAPGRELRAALQWAEANREELMNTWRRWNA